jgi:type IV secretory pathway ATPase VirB11/archaellum biosynthesis ATPase
MLSRSLGIVDSERLLAALQKGRRGEEIHDDERIFVIEDTAEIRLNKPHVVSSESQSNTHKQEISFDTLLKAALRHRPDRIILGEVPRVRSQNVARCDEYRA